MWDTMKQNHLEENFKTLLTILANSKHVPNVSIKVVTFTKYETKVQMNIHGPITTGKQSNGIPTGVK